MIVAGDVGGAKEREREGEQVLRIAYNERSEGNWAKHTHWH